MCPFLYEKFRMDLQIKVQWMKKFSNPCNNSLSLTEQRDKIKSFTTTESIIFNYN